MNLERELQRALRRESPAPGLAARVLARAQAEAEEPRIAHPRRHWWRAAAASLTLAAVLGGWAAHQVAERREGERAREQVLLAMRIAGSKVRYAQEQVRGIGTEQK
ncbi:MAG TPA: hypothetical protein VFN10_00635 [Thermoanaerobaculia bacterium]|nr:hypothetical protein [Thermoanaerobaculia bacterium]